ncbi:hypothetical protein Klosneuvirus_1_119 [Klosneuvirus KNV1]|uniref:Uncharacterized protein n=1 Tax=Klosneuvirus KNV1 TaxID=1977640 RepID=A0A1V0SHS1_9VIRU|nr:hypothetical protein Klosneuvirus_1_119 [Klosneuvirus KNV1]
MRIDKGGPYVPFTIEHIKNKHLVIKMLNYEEEFTKSKDGQLLYHNPLNRPIVSLTIEKIIHRIVLTKFGFDTSDESVANYRLIYKTYYKSPNEYDKDVINAVHYMRENKCAYYKSPVFEIGQKIPDCILFHLDGKSVTTLHDIINKKNADHILIAAFSLS